MEPQKSQEPCRRREKSGKHPQKARELGGRRRNRKENSKKKLREFERIEESGRIGLELIEHQEERNGTNQKKAEKDKEEGTFWKKGHQNSINKACTYLRKERTPPWELSLSKSESKQVSNKKEQVRNKEYSIL